MTSLADEMEAAHRRDYERERRVSDVARAIAALEPADLPVHKRDVLEALGIVRAACEDTAASIVRRWD